MKFNADAGTSILQTLDDEQLRGAMQQAKSYLGTKAFQEPEDINPNDDFWRMYQAVFIEEIEDRYSS